MRSQRANVVTLVAVLLLLVLVAVFAGPDERAQHADPRASTFRSGPNGTRALLLLVRELGMLAAPLLQPWAADLEDGVVVALAPVQEPTGREVEALLGWVRAGGTLIYAASGAGDPVIEALGLSLARAPSTGVRTGVRPALRDAPRVPSASGAPITGDHDALLEGLDSVPGFQRAFADGQDAGTRVLLSTAEGDAVVLDMVLDSGRVVVWSDAAVLSNARLREDGGAALLFARVAAEGVRDGGGVRFDEYHHGFRDGGPVSALRTFVLTTGAGRGLLQVIIAGLALLLLFGRRFGAPNAEQAGRRRSPLEHVEALATAYRRAGADATARRLLVAGLERRIGRRLLNPSGELVEPALDGTAAGKRLREEWERGELTGLAGAIDDFAVEVTRWK